MSNTFIFRPLVASEASRWSIISSFEARSPFVYSIRIPACSPTSRVRRNYQKAKGLRGHCTGQGEGDARVGGKGQTGCMRLRPGPLLAAVSLTAAWQRNLFHSKRSLNGTANSATTCRWQAASARQRRIQQGADARSSSQSVPLQYGGGRKKKKERPGALLARRTRGLGRSSFDVRSRGQPWPLPPILNTREERNERKGRPQIAPSARKTGCGKGTAVRDNIYAAVREQLRRL
jgi:hypothetical protein